MPRSLQVFRIHKGEGRWVLVFLLFSFLFNCAFLLLVSLFHFGGVLQPKKMVSIQQGVVEETERTEPVTQREDISLDKVAARQRGAGVTDYAALVQGEVSVIEVDTPGLAGLGMDLNAVMGTGISESAWAMPTGKKTRKIKMGDPHQLEDVLDDVAKTVLQIIERHKLLVVLLLDESRSLQDDREIMAAKLEMIFRDLQFAMTDAEARNLAWAVVSYGKAPRELLGPTRQMAPVRQAIVNVRTDITGEENTVQALNFVQDRFGRANIASRRLILCLTDEQGSDNAAKPVEEVVDRLKKGASQFFVLGRESYFDRATVHEVDPATGLSGPVDRGLPTAGAEVLPHYWHYVWAGSYPSGFGPYWLSTICNHTNGRFFMLSTDRARYKSETLERYKPEWCLPSTYEKRNKENPLRGAIVETISQSYANLPANHGYFRHRDAPEDVLPWEEQQKFFEQQVELAKNKIKWVDEAIEKLKGLSGRRTSDKDAKYRWTANYDLLLGDLYKMKYGLIQMREIHERAAGLRAMPRPTRRDADPYIRFDIYQAERDKRTGALKGAMLGGSEAAGAKQHAIAAYDKAIASCKDTPWEDRAASAKQNWPILQMTFSSVRYGGGGGQYVPRL